MQGLGGSLEVRVLLSSFKGSFLRVLLRMSKSFNACCRGGFRVQGFGFWGSKGNLFKGLL